MDLVRARYIEEQITKLSKGNITYRTTKGKNMLIFSGRRKASSVIAEYRIRWLLSNIGI